MKKNKLPYLLLTLLIAVAAYYYFDNKQGKSDKREGALSDFAIKDTASITKIFIADAQGGEVTLSKKENKWVVNNQYDARPNNVKLLLKMFNRIAVKMPVPNVAFNNVVKNIATNSIKVEIYQGEQKPSKVYYLGGPTLNHQGTYMLLEENGVKSTVPYIMHIPGFNGFLTARFFTNPQQWRDAVIFKYKPETIKQIAVTYYETPKESFVIEQQNKQFQLFAVTGSAPIKNVNARKLQNYVERYQKVYYEMIDDASSQKGIDSVIASQPYFSIKVTDMEGVSNKIVAYHMPNFSGKVDANDELFEYDIDRMYAYLNEDLFLFIQFPTFDQLRLPKSYFFQKK